MGELLLSERGVTFTVCCGRINMFYFIHFNYAIEYEYTICSYDTAEYFKGLLCKKICNCVGK
jgi:hypothetical protein